MRSLSEAIQHCLEVAEKQEKSACYMKNKYGEHVAGYRIHTKCATEHRQLAYWLMDLKAVHDEIDGMHDEEMIYIGHIRKFLREEVR